MGNKIDNIKTFLFKKIGVKKMYCLFSFSLFLSLIEITLYSILVQFCLEQYWLLLPIGIYIIFAILAKSFHVIRVISVSLELSSIFSFLLFVGSVRNVWISSFISRHYENISIIILLALFLNFYVSKIQGRNATDNISTTPSIIGIYRGNIDFSQRESISSKFLEMVSMSYNQNCSTSSEPIVEMKMSSRTTQNNSNPFDFNHQKLTEKINLIDVIAIIQELNFDRNE